MSAKYPAGDTQKWLNINGKKINQEVQTNI